MAVFVREDLTGRVTRNLTPRPPSRSGKGEEETAGLPSPLRGGVGGGVWRPYGFRILCILSRGSLGLSSLGLSPSLGLSSFGLSPLGLSSLGFSLGMRASSSSFLVRCGRA